MYLQQKNEFCSNNKIVFSFQKKIIESKKLSLEKEELSFLEAALGNETCKKPRQIRKFFLPSGKNVIIVTIKENIVQEELLEIGGLIGKKILELCWNEADCLVATLPDVQEQGYHALLKGILLGHYSFTTFKSKNENTQENVSLNIIADTSPVDEKMLFTVQAIAEGVTLTRDVGNTPGNYLRPYDVTQKAKYIAEKFDLQLNILDEAAMKTLGFGCLLAVAAGSEQPPYCSILEYKPSQPCNDTLLLVGKAITFDSGGISIKPAAKMGEMKFDMSGGGAVLGAMMIIGALKPNVNVVAIIPSSENLINGKAYKPGDIVTAYNGTTVEVDNTDAEGRLILADALAYGIKKYSPAAVVDVATLTGACVIALGSVYTGLMANDDWLAAELIRLGHQSGDKVWRLPLHKRYKKQIEGEYGDIKNTGGRDAGTITAAEFLHHFVDKTPWAHLDIAGTAWDVKLDYYPKVGATGVGACLLADLALQWKK